MRRVVTGNRCRAVLGMFVCTVSIMGIAGVASAVGAVAWSVRGAAMPSEFTLAEGNRFDLLVMNTGSEPSTEGPTILDRLPAGMTMTTFESRTGVEGGEWSCGEVEASVVSCTLIGEALPAGGYAPNVAIEVSAPSESSTPLENQVTASGGGASVSASTSQSVTVGSAPQQFGVSEFSIEAHDAEGAPALQAGGHPWEITASLGFPWSIAPPNSAGHHYRQVENIKKIAVELPAGLVGNFATTSEHCTQDQLGREKCPLGSRVGSLALTAGQFEFAPFRFSTEPSGPSFVYNMIPEPGYPVQLGFSYAHQPVYLDASVIHTTGGERVRLATVSAPPALETGNVILTLWGEPGQFNESGSEEAALTNPTACSEKPLNARVEAESWGHQKETVSAETTVYSHITGCGALLSGFTPGLAFGPLTGEEGTTQADSPSGFEGVGTVSQTTGFNENAVSHVRNVDVELPAGLSVSPAAAQGLVGCKERGPEGINLGTSRIGPGGVDEGNPEATEFGAGHGGGNGSSYDDGQYHTAPGHCPEASIVGGIEVFTPLLATRCGGAEQLACAPGESPAPLRGHVFIAQPKCGGAGQAACSGLDAEDGKLFAGYVELSGDGVLIKERATISVNQATGGMALQLRELPQFPFSEVRVHVHGGQRAPLETPQTCGGATTDAVFTPWSSVSSGEVFVSTPSTFAVDGDGAGGSCPATWPLTPGFTGGSVNSSGGGFTHFATALTRKDREQNLTGLTVRPPLGLLAMLSSVTPCPEPQAAAGECPESSLIGHDTAGAGSGSEPFYVSGRVYLTGPYKGAPFGLAVVTPAAAGPFNLGNVVVRATINVDPSTAAVTITSDPIPQSKLGVPLRLKALNVTIDKDNFVFNPTNCSAQQYAASVTGNQGGTTALSTPFAVTGCAALPSHPVLKITTPGKASKKNGAGLTVTFQSSQGQANIKSVKVNVPKQLPSRLATLQKACTDAVFKANPAGCPAASVVGTSVLHTPILKSPMTGPIYLVSHGGAAFPDLVFVLQGEGITINLDGNTNIKKGITSETFKAVPDAPFTSFTATFPQGPHSVLATNLPAKAKFNLCGQKLKMPVRIVAQNNKVTTETGKVGVSGCRHKPKR